jgi:hypothetical protein
VVVVGNPRKKRCKLLILLCWPRVSKLRKKQRREKRRKGKKRKLSERRKKPKGGMSEEMILDPGTTEAVVEPCTVIDRRLIIAIVKPLPSVLRSGDLATIAERAVEAVIESAKAVEVGCSGVPVRSAGRKI